jgi:hypothetical protein
MELKKLLLITATLCLCYSCTSVTVRPVDSGLSITDVCIEENPKVIVHDFLSVVRDGFDRHGIVTKIVTRPAPIECEYILSYTALQNWDMDTYLHHAELRLERNGRIVGSAEYHLTGKGGLSLMKWQSTKTKMDPVIDELLANMKR